MPPVLAPTSPSPSRLKSWDGASAVTFVPVTEHHHRALRSVQALFDDHGASRRRRRRGRSVSRERRRDASSRSSVTSTPLPAARPSVLMTYGGVIVAKERQRRVFVVEDAVGRARDVRAREELLQVRLRTFEAARRRRPDRRPSCPARASRRRARRPPAGPGRSRRGRRRAQSRACRRT